MPIYNPAPASSSGSSAVPQSVANAITFTIATNTQVPLANQLVTEAGGIVLTAGTGAITWLN